MGIKRLFLGCICCISIGVHAQYASQYNNGLVVKFNEDGSSYLRTLLWGQFWFQNTEGSSPNDGISVRRARLAMYSQINKKFLFFIHFGLNSLNDNNLSPTGKSTDTTLFLHDAWAEYMINANHSIGTGLHYWNGISRLNNAGTLNFMTLDGPRSYWSTLGLSDQFGRHIGVYAKGNIGKFHYRASVNDALTNSLDGDINTILENEQIAYLGKALTNKGKYAVSGYFEYQFLDRESNLLPFKAGTYLGAKKVFNIGAGVFHHQNGLVRNVNNNLTNENVTHLAVDAYYDAPIGGNNSAISAYASVQHSDMGGDYLLGDIVGDGNQFYGQLGYLIPKKDPKNKYSNRLQPYVAYAYRNFNALPEPAQELKIGGNWYLDGQNAKISVEYQRSFHLPENRNDMFVIQAMILL